MDNNIKYFDDGAFDRGPNDFAEENHDLSW
jgi:hypothetical protein